MDRAAPARSTLRPARGPAATWPAATWPAAGRYLAGRYLAGRYLAGRYLRAARLSAALDRSPDRVAVSVVVPVYDEEANLPQLADELRAVFDADPERTYEAVFVDDRSRDGSLAALLRLAAADARLRVLRHGRNSGQSAALASGFRAARGAVVVTLDADLQNDPADIPALLAALEGCDVVCGIRSRRRDGWVRRASSRIANRVRNLLLHDGVSDVGCSLKAMRAELLDELPVFNGMHRFLPALLRLRGARIREIPVGHRPRLHGESKYGIHNRLWRGLADLAAVRWMQKRSVAGRHAEEIEIER